MNFKQRLPYFLFGLTIGIIIAFFILNKKETDFSYAPNARVLKNIRLKKPIFSKKAKQIITEKKIDTASISAILKNGNADMWNKIKKDTCTQYKITGKDSLKNVTLVIDNCSSTAIIRNIKVN